jgi:hypothetical protein
MKDTVEVKEEAPVDDKPINPMVERNDLLVSKSDELKYMTIDLLTKVEYLKKKKLVMKINNKKLRSILGTMKKIYTSKKHK